MKKFLGYLIFTFLMFIPGSVVFAAGSINPSTTNINVEKGKTTTFTIRANNVAGNVLIQSSDTSAVSVSPSSYFFDTAPGGNESVTVTVTAHKAGTASIYIVLEDVGTYDEVPVELTGRKEVNINITEPAPVEQAQPVQQTQTTTTKNIQTQAKKEETKEEEVKKEEVKEEEKKEEVKIPKNKLTIDKFYVVGYDIGFDPEKLDYTIDIDDTVKAIYIVVSGENLEVIGDKEVDITDKSSVVVRLKNGNTIEEYTIKLHRISNSIKKEKSKANIVLVGTTIFFALTTIGLGTYVLIKRKYNADWR